MDDPTPKKRRVYSAKEDQAIQQPSLVASCNDEKTGAMDVVVNATSTPVLDEIARLLLIDLQQELAEKVAETLDSLSVSSLNKVDDANHTGAKHRTRALNLGGISFVIMAMCKWKAHDNVQQHGCYYLMLLMGDYALGERASELVANSGGLEAIISAMNTFPHSEIVQQNSLHALFNMTRGNHDNNMSTSLKASMLRLLQDLDGFSLIARAMELFPDAELIQKWAIGNLLNISYYTDGSALKTSLKANEHHFVIELGGFANIVCAMKRFPNSAKLLEFSCYLLYNYSCGTQYHDVLVEEGATTIAATLHEKHFRNRKVALAAAAFLSQIYG